jgi:hypothetical protein
MTGPPADRVTARPATTPRTGPANASGTSLADRQAALVASLVSGTPAPAGFDSSRLAAARDALLRKRAGEVATSWPLLAAAYGPQWTVRFAEWAAGRSPAGAFRDGFDFARSLAAHGDLPDLAARELAEREAQWRYDGTDPPALRASARIQGLFRRLTRWAGAA